MKSNDLWYIIDATKAKCYLECPRKFWWEHILGWRTAGSNINLIFGEAFHKVMETMLLEGYTVDAIEKGIVLFKEVYYKHFSPLTDAERAPKNPIYAEAAALEYAKNYAADISRYEVLHTEVSGSVPVAFADEERKIQRLHFKIDSILRDKELDAIISREHKTTGQSLSAKYANQWPLSFQVGCYNHVLRAFYQPDEVYGVEVNAISLLKTKFGFQRYPVRKTAAQMEVWREIADSTLWNIECDINRYLEELDDPDFIMHAFPLNPQSCDRWYGCPYLDFCISWENPAQRVLEFAEPPQGFQVEFWDPRAIETREKVEL